VSYGNNAIFVKNLSDNLMKMGDIYAEFWKVFKERFSSDYKSTAQTQQACNLAWTEVKKNRDEAQKKIKLWKAEIEKRKAAHKLTLLRHYFAAPLAAVVSPPPSSSTSSSAEEATDEPPHSPQSVSAESDPNSSSASAPVTTIEVEIGSSSDEENAGPEEYKKRARSRAQDDVEARLAVVQSDISTFAAIQTVRGLRDVERRKSNELMAERIELQKKLQKLQVIPSIIEANKQLTQLWQYAGAQNITNNSFLYLNKFFKVNFQFFFAIV